jgi:2-dehydro-3-deoxygluconokinase
MPDIIALGEPLIEYNQLPAERGGRGDGRLFLRGFGGDASNFIIAAARQGAATGFLTALGDDENSRLFRDLWDAEGVDHSRVESRKGAPTGSYFVSHGLSGHQFSFARAGSASSLYGPDDLPLDYIAEAKVLHLTGISLAISTKACDAGFAAMEAARKAGCKVSFDTNLRLKLWPLERARAVIREAIRLCDICLPSFEDAAALSGLNRPDAILDWCIAQGPSVVALKLGKDGALIAAGGRRFSVPPHPCQPIDATGAGDTFGGAFIARLVMGDDAEKAGRYAAAAAALSTEGYGAVEPIPHAAQVWAAMGGA